VFKIKLTLFSCILVASLGLLGQGSALAQGPFDDLQDDPFVAGEILVKFKPGVGVQNAQQRVAEVQGAVAGSVANIGTLRIKVPPGQELAAIEKLKARGDVEYVEPNYIVWALGTPNDPSYGSQWGLPKINMPQAWDITEGSSNIIVAIVDTGIDLEHPDFNCTVPGGANKLTAGFDFYNNDTNPDDDQSHGSHVAGIAGACTNNSTGVAGVAPNVRLMPVKVLNSSGNGTYADVASGITYAADNGAKIINLSLGGSDPSETVRIAMAYAVGKGALVVAAAGNFAHVGNPVIYPAAYADAMAVAATDSGDNWATFSEHHSYVEVAAPGVSIYSTVLGFYGTKSGTSMSTPHVAGLAALIWSLEPGLTNAEVRQIIQDTAKDLGDPGKDDYFGYGRIDAQQALQQFVSLNLQDLNGQSVPNPIVFLADDHPVWGLPEPQTLQVTTSNPGTITWTATISPNVSWLGISPTSTGQVSASSSAQFSLNITRPTSYNKYTTSLIVTGTTASGLTLDPVINQVNLTYVKELHRYWFPIILK